MEIAGQNAGQGVHRTGLIMRPGMKAMEDTFGVIKLNVGWNPTFFYYHNVFAGLLLIGGLTVLIGFFLFFYWPELKLKSALILPYFIWLLIATSLNGYIFLHLST
jgi:tryptophan-rich sensory protein